MALNATVELVAGGVPDTVIAGKPFKATIRVSNHSSEPLLPGQDRLGSWAPMDNQLWGNTRAELKAAVAPNTGMNFEIDTFVPTTVGNQPFAWKMVRDDGPQRGWYGTPSVTKMINVVPGTGPAPPPINDPKLIIGKLPGRRADPLDLVSNIILNTDAFPADNTSRHAIWPNHTGETIHIVAARLWLGVDMNGQCDCHAELRRSDGTLLAVLQADHYVNSSNGAAIEYVNYGDKYISLLPNETLRLGYFANGFGRRPNAAFTVTIWAYYGDAK